MQRVLSGVRPPPTPTDPHTPATKDDLRTLRRWVVVAGAWALAATAVALVALLDDSGRAAERRANQTGDRVAAVESRLDRKLNQLDARLRRMPTSAQVAAARRSADGAAGKASTLDDRVSALEDGSGTPSGGGGSSGVPSLRDLFP